MPDKNIDYVSSFFEPCHPISCYFKKETSMKTKLVFIMGILLTGMTLQSQIILEDTEVDTATVISGLDIPWEIIYGPDDHLWITERYGIVSRIFPATGDRSVILDLTAVVYQNGESGLLGMVLHPDFENFPFVYLAYTYYTGSSILERIARYEYIGSSLVNEFVLLDNIPGNTTHDGARLIITPDLKLLITTGDAQNQPAAQDINSLNGKILRINLDGSIPEDNPWEGNPAYTFGHRNAQGLFLAPNGILYSSEHGPSTDDEFNMIEAGRNYGWPNVHGFCDLPGEITFCDDYNVYEPLVAWTPTIATSDILYYSHEAIPEWQNRILLTTLKNKRLYVLELDESGMEVINEDQYFFDYWGRLRDVCMGPDGSIFLATNGPGWGNVEPFTHRIVKIWNPDYIQSAHNAEAHITKVSMYPNPVKDNLFIGIDDPNMQLHVQIHSNNGNMVVNQVIDNTLNVIPTKKLKSGIYMVVIGDGQKPVYSGKIMVLKN
jgi:glucose/arabinose dehydrogenase